MAIDFPRRKRPQQRIALLIGIVVVLLFFSRSICSLILDYAWWGELGQVPTWIRMSAYQYGPDARGVAHPFSGAVDRARARVEVRGHAARRASDLFAPGDAGAGDAVADHCAIGDRRVDRRAIFWRSQHDIRL